MPSMTGKPSIAGAPRCTAQLRFLTIQCGQKSIIRCAVMWWRRVIMPANLPDYEPSKEAAEGKSGLLRRSREEATWSLIWKSSR